MKFIVDEQLPSLLADWLEEKGHDAIHISALLTGIKIPDSYICALSMRENRIVITKDNDFFNTYLLKKEPYKMVYMTTGNLRNRPLLALFRTSFSQLVRALETANVIELNQQTLKIWF